MPKKKVIRKARRQAGAQKRPVKKVTRRRRKTALGKFNPEVPLDIEQVYKAINKVQLAKEEVTFMVNEGDSAVVENILKDLTLKFNKSLTPDKCTKFHVIPSPDKFEDRDFDDVEQFPDEIAEEGQIFFD